MASEFDFEKAAKKIVVAAIAATREIENMREAMTTPPAAMQGHWVEPRTGRMLQIDADGTVARRDPGEKEIHLSRYESAVNDFGLNDFILESDEQESTLGPLLPEWEGKTRYYARAGVDELRLLAWLRERGL